MSGLGPIRILTIRTNESGRMATTQPSQQTPAGGPEQHGRRTAPLVEVVADLERAQNHEDVEGFLRLFRSDAVWVTAHGKRLTGLDEIAAFTRRVLPGAMRDASARYEVVNVLFVRPDVAVVNVRQTPLTADGQPSDRELPGSPVYVLVSEEGRWLIVAGQNTKVQPPPA